MPGTPKNMNEDKSVLLQKQVRDNSEDLRAYLNDLLLWEKEMKRKESEMNDEKDDKPKEASKKKKPDKTKSQKQPRKKTSGCDYAAWDKFDAEGECEKIDNDKVSDSSDNETDALEQQKELLKQESLQEKERGNEFVREKKWREAIACYTHAIACYSKDPVYYANRALCFLKKEDYNNAEIDCTAALKLEPNYVKALQRRAAATAALNQIHDAIVDLERVMELEPHNAESKSELQKLSKLLKPDQEVTILEPIPSTSKDTQSTISTVKHTIPWPDRKSGVEVTAVKKPPHLRSKTPLCKVVITESNDLEPKAEPKQQNHVSNVVDSSKGVTATEVDHTPTNAAPVSNIDYGSSEALASILAQSKQLDVDDILNDIEGSPKEAAVMPQTPLVTNQSHKIVSIASKIQRTATSNSESKLETYNFPVPKSSVQFYANWKAMRNCSQQKYKYLEKIKPGDLPNIFQQYLESDILSDIINVLEEHFIPEGLDVYSYLLALSQLGRFSALVMFLSNKDKSVLNNLLEYCSMKNISSEKVNALRKAYEL